MNPNPFSTRNVRIDPVIASCLSAPYRRSESPIAPMERHRHHPVRLTDRAVPFSTSSVCDARSSRELGVALPAEARPGHGRGRHGHQRRRINSSHRGGGEPEKVDSAERIPSDDAAKRRTSRRWATRRPSAGCWSAIRSNSTTRRTGSMRSRGHRPITRRARRGPGES